MRSILHVSVNVRDLRVPDSLFETTLRRDLSFWSRAARPTDVEASQEEQPASSVPTQPAGDVPWALTNQYIYIYVYVNPPTNYRPSFCIVNVQPAFPASPGFVIIPESDPFFNRTCQRSRSGSMLARTPTATPFALPIRNQLSLGKHKKQIFWETIRPNSQKTFLGFSLGQNWFRCAKPSFPTKKMVLDRKTNIFLGRRQKGLFWETLRPKPKKMFFGFP